MILQPLVVDGAASWHARRDWFTGLFLAIVLPGVGTKRLYGLNEPESEAFGGSRSAPCSRGISATVCEPRREGVGKYL